MTLEQFIGALLGVALVAVTRLVDRWLPPTESHSDSDTSHPVDPTMS